MDNWTEDEIYEAFLDVMFTEWDADSMAYMHLTVMEGEQ